MRRIMLLVTVATLMAAMLVLAGVAWAQSTAKPVDPPKQVAQLRQQFEGLSTKQAKARGYVPEGPCVANPMGPGAMGIHAINHKLLQAQFPKGKMDPEKPPVLLLARNGKVMGVEWEAADVGQGPMKMFRQTIELQSGHPGAEEPHYMLHIYFRAGGKVLFGTNDQTAFDPEGICPRMSASATASASPSASAAATSTATATSSASELADTGGPTPMPVLAAGALALLLVGGLMAATLVRRS
jgi:hypothetical protein